MEGAQDDQWSDIKHNKSNLVCNCVRERERGRISLQAELASGFLECSYAAIDPLGT